MASLRACLPFAVLVAGCSGDSPATTPKDFGAGADDEAPLAADMAIEGANVLEHHHRGSRDGLYADPAFTASAAAGLKRDPSFLGTVAGHVYAQPLFLEGGPAGRAVVIVVTQLNNVYALDAADGSVAWQRNVGVPVARRALPCGNIDPLGITSTPVIDFSSRTVVLDAMTTPDGGASKRHLVLALDADTGAVRPGFPVDVNERASFAGLKFDSAVQNQRGALAILGGVAYVPFGGHFGDCGDYHGWLLGVPLATPQTTTAWATRARAGGVWAVGGVASDGASLYVATGNTFGANSWMDGEAVFKLDPGPVARFDADHYYAPANWPALDAGDIDIGGSAPLLLDVPGAVPARLVMALGKDGVAYLLDRDHLGGIGGEVAKKQVASNAIIQAAASYRTAQATYVVFHGNGVGCPGGSGDLTAIAISATTPPAMRIAWCARENGRGSPAVTTSDGVHDAIVWALGAEGDQKLHGFDGDTGAVVYAGGGPDELMTGTRRFQTVIAARGRLLVAADNRVYAFKP